MANNSKIKVTWVMHFVFASIIFTLLFGCQQSNGSKFLGKWQDTSTSHLIVNPIEITREGDKYLCTDINEHTHKGIGTLKDGTINFGNFMANYVSSSDTLILSSELMGSHEMQRIK